MYMIVHGEEPYVTRLTLQKSCISSNKMTFVFTQDMNSCLLAESPVYYQSIHPNLRHT